MQSSIVSFVFVCSWGLFWSPACFLRHKNKNKIFPVHHDLMSHNNRTVNKLMLLLFMWLQSQWILILDWTMQLLVVNFGNICQWGLFGSSASYQRHQNREKHFLVHYDMMSHKNKMVNYFCGLSLYGFSPHGYSFLTRECNQKW